MESSQQNGAGGPTPEQQRIISKLVGLPFMVLNANSSYDHKVVGQLLGGEKIRAEYVHEVWNGALCWDAIEGSGAWRRAASAPQLQVLAIGERLFGCTIENALPVWLSMPRMVYADWMNRPRVVWPGCGGLVN